MASSLWLLQFLLSTPPSTSQSNTLALVLLLMLLRFGGGHVGTHSPPTFEVLGSDPGPYVEKKLVVAYRWLAVYSTEP